jgi:hypothetical protein
VGHNDTTALQAASAIGQLLLPNYTFDESLSFDLYGSHTADDGFYVETVMIAGTQHNVTTLLSGKQLENLGKFLDMKDDLTPVGRDWASRHRSAATHY